MCSRQPSAAPGSVRQLPIPALCGPSGLQQQPQLLQLQQQQQFSQYGQQDPSLTLLLLQHKQAQVTAAAVAAAKLGRSGSTGLDQAAEGRIPAAWSLQPAYSTPVRSATTSALQYTHLWHARLRLQQGDTIAFALHLWQRLRDWVRLATLA